MTLKNFSTINTYYERQMADFKTRPTTRGPAAGAVPDTATLKTAVRDRVLTAYHDVYGTLTADQEEMLRRMWSLEDDIPVLSLVASKPVTGPADPALAIEAPDKDLDARVAALMAHWDDESPEDVPGPGEGATPPSAPSTEDPPTGATGPGTQDDPALD